ncbi:MAG: hypothetical protein NTU80_13665 [Verrucomicrobia bacterium]|nr:hypothetical protein [Verrucomicrobiota bacterium]
MLQDEQQFFGYLGVIRLRVWAEFDTDLSADLETDGFEQILAENKVTAAIGVVLQCAPVSNPLEGYEQSAHSSVFKRGSDGVGHGKGVVAKAVIKPNQGCDESV